MIQESAAPRPQLRWTGERLVPELMHPGERMVVEHMARYWWAADRIEALSKRVVVLDAPSGAGYGTAILTSPSNVAMGIGIDCDTESVVYAQARYGVPGRVLFRTGDMTRLHTRADVVVCFEGIEHVIDQGGAARSLCDALKPGGRLFVSTPRRGSLGAGSPHHTHELDLDEFTGLFAPYLSEWTVHGQTIGVGDQTPETARFFLLEGRR
jgi:SAM-dependent methyltransferase